MPGTTWRRGSKNGRHKNSCAGSPILSELSNETQEMPSVVKTDLEHVRRQLLEILVEKGEGKSPHAKVGRIKCVRVQDVKFGGVQEVLFENLTGNGGTVALKD